MAATAERPPAPRAVATRGRLRLLVFVVGASSLGTEIAATRLLAPYFGTSTIVWANTIAVVLVSLSVGYWVGGRLADRRPELRTLCWLVLAAGVGLAIVPYVARPFLDAAVGALEAISAGAAAGSLVAVSVLVSGPLLLLGTIAPYAVRLAVTDVEQAGSVTGRLYALSTVGSLLGTFAAALALIPWAGTHRTFLIFALALTAVAAVGLPRRALLVPAALIVLVALPPGAIRADTTDGRMIYEAETPYQYARVVQTADGTRRLELNEGLAIHSIYRPGRYLVGGYWDELLVLPRSVLPSAPGRVAILGNGAGTTARAYGHFFPATRIDGVELDGELTDIGRRLFDLRAPHLRLFTADARVYLRRTSRRFDAIVVDAYRQPYIPFYLATRELFTLVRARLRPGGVLLVNVGHPAGSEALEQALTATMHAALPNVWRDPVTPTNTVLAASARPIAPNALRAAIPRLPVALRPLATRTAQRLEPGMRGGPVYTDDRAPIEWLIDRSILGFATDAG